MLLRLAEHCRSLSIQMADLRLNDKCFCRFLAATRVTEKPGTLLHFPFISSPPTSHYQEHLLSIQYHDYGRGSF